MMITIMITGHIKAVSMIAVIIIAVVTAAIIMIVGMITYKLALCVAR